MNVVSYINRWCYSQEVNSCFVFLHIESVCFDFTFIFITDLAAAG